MKKQTFSEKCYNILRKVPRGKVTTYKEIANALGTKAYRAVGNAMNKNPYAHAISPEAIRNRHSGIRGNSKRTNGFFLVACHRVVKSNGELGGFASGIKNKIKILKKEGVLVKRGKVQNFENVLYKFNNS